MTTKTNPVDALAALTAAGVLALGGIFLLVILGTLMGAFAGWIVGMVFNDSMMSVLSALGVHGVSMWQFGAFIGFIGGFLKTKVSKE